MAHVSSCVFYTAIHRIEEELQAESLELKNRCADLDCRNADLDQREVGRMGRMALVVEDVEESGLGHMT